MLANDARILVCDVDGTRLTGIVLQGLVDQRSSVTVQPTQAARVPRHAVTSCYGDVSFHFGRAMAHDSKLDIVLRCRRMGNDEIDLAPLVTKRRRMPDVADQLAASKRVFCCWSVLCELGLPRGTLPLFDNDAAA